MSEDLSKDRIGSVVLTPTRSETPPPLPVEAADSSGADSLILAADRKRKAADASRPAPRRRSGAEAKADASAVDLPSIDSEIAPADTPAEPTTRRRRRSAEGPIARRVSEDEPPVRRARRPRTSVRPVTVAPDPGLVTRGVHAGLDSVDAVGRGSRRLGPWGIAALAVVLASGVLIGLAIDATPEPPRVRKVEAAWLPGPKVADPEFRSWIASFPQRDQLPRANDWVLDQLADHLRKHPAVAEVARVRLVNDTVDPADPGRSIVVSLRLRSPVMPVTLVSGARAWLDADGHVLPGMLPGPAVRRPVVHEVETAGTGIAAAAVQLWQRLEARLEPGLVQEMHLNAPLEDAVANGPVPATGIVLVTRQGTRLIWGRPEDERYGLDASARLEALIHTIRCQGDLSATRSVNVRFKKPFFTLLQR